MQLTTWRLIETPPATGAWNMAVDEVLLESMSLSSVESVLRLYSWNPPCLSIGYAQNVADVDMTRLENFGWELVRRITGGRAILHSDEITYAVIGPHSEPRLGGGVLKSYRRLSEALLAALIKIGLPAQALPHPKGESSDSSEQERICFEQPSNYEITVDGKKLIGSAQARKNTGVLQHGTLPLYGDLTRITQVLKFKDEEERAFGAQRLLSRATTVERVLNQSVNLELSAKAFVEAFSETLNLDLKPSTLTNEELTRAEELVNEKYALPAWTKRI
ncbi:MAG: biotin/lipoate A/B protein ligase family protein [Chloroflexota bacterium]